MQDVAAHGLPAVDLDEGGAVAPEGREPSRQRRTSGSGWRSPQGWEPGDNTRQTAGRGAAGRGTEASRDGSPEAETTVVEQHELTTIGEISGAAAAGADPKTLYDAVFGNLLERLATADAEERKRLAATKPANVDLPWAAAIAGTVEHAAVTFGLETPAWCEEPNGRLTAAAIGGQTHEEWSEAFPRRARGIRAAGSVPGPGDDREGHGRTDPGAARDARARGSGLGDRRGRRDRETVGGRGPAGPRLHPHERGDVVVYPDAEPAPDHGAEPVRPRAPTKRFRRRRKKAQRKPFTVYQIRHSFATWLRHAGADLADIQDLYGHADAATTRIYAAPTLAKQGDAIQRLRLVSSLPSECDITRAQRFPHLV